VTLGADKDSVVSQIMWATRWVESGNDYNSNRGRTLDPNTPPCCSGAYQNHTHVNWKGYQGYPEAAAAPPEVQDEFNRNLIGAKFDSYQGNVEKVIKSHLCPAYVDPQYNDTRCGGNPTMDAYYSCTAVLLNALQGKEVLPIRFSDSQYPNLESSCRGRISSALSDPALPSSASMPSGSVLSATTVVAVGDSVLEGAVTSGGLKDLIGSRTLIADTKVGRTVPEGLAALQSHKDQIAGSVVVIGLGHNGGDASFPGQLDQIMTATTGAARVILLTQSPYNDTMRTVVNPAIRAAASIPDATAATRNSRS
jgi:hypothetical protein